MAQPTDKLDSEILPDAELNPLLNPLLGAHMGRWAEVYFTSPPEKRAQAVSDLVRELKNEPPPPAGPIRENTNRVPEKHPKGDTLFKQEHVERQAASAKDSSMQICSVCSAENAAGQRFCGMCGATLQPARRIVAESTFNSISLPEETIQAAEEQEISKEQIERSELSGGGARQAWAESEHETASAAYAAEYPEPEPFPAERRHIHSDAAEPGWRLPESELPHFAVESETVSYRTRLYVGIAVALVLGVMVYKGWHGTGAPADDSSESRPARVVPSAPPRSAPVATPEANPRTVLPTEGSSATPSSSTPPASTSSRTSAPAPAAAAAAKKEVQPLSAPRRQEPARAPARIASVASSAPGAAASATNDKGGAEELATANEYLNANRARGGRNNSNAEAAQWLWKAVGKGNVTATLVLSDLYLRGDGVPKSCDQARLLLDVAARKGKASAGERLRNLQAFGCQ